MMKIFWRFQDLGLEGAQAKLYDKNTRQLRITEIKKEANEATGYIWNGDYVLEIAPGSGYLSIELAKLGNFKITGLDISNLSP